MATPLLTVGVPTRNRPALLCAAGDSALAQNVRGLEAIVVDDAARLELAGRLVSSSA